MKRNILLGFLLIGLICFSACKKESVDDNFRILEQSEYEGVYAVIRTELLGFDEDMNAKAKHDTFFHDMIIVDYIYREDSTFISSDQFLYEFSSVNDGLDGERRNWSSTLTNSGTKFTKTDSALLIEGYAQQGSRIQTTRKFNGKEL